MSDDREPSLLIDFVWLAGLALALLGYCATATGCRTVVEVPGPPRPCLTQPPPAVRLAPRVREGCPAALVCLTDDGARETAHAVESARGWMADAWAGCGNPPESPDGSPPP